MAVVGSGPAGLAAADQLNRAGHSVTVFEKSDRIGGLLRYGIPEFKMEKRVLDRRLGADGGGRRRLPAGVNVGVDVPVSRLRSDFDAVLLAGGAGQPRDLPVPGRELKGVHFAMEYLTLQNRRCEGDAIPDDQFISAAGQARRHHRRRRHRRRLPRHRASPGRAVGARSSSCCRGRRRRARADNPWPQWPNIFRVSTAHEEGGERLYSVSTQRFVGDDAGACARCRPSRSRWSARTAACEFEPVPGTEFEIPADLVLLAMGFVGPERGPLVNDLGVKLTERGNVWRDERWMTSVPGVFTAGDMQRGQSLIVWAIAEGRSAARGIDQYLMGESKLPAPLA